MAFEVIHKREFNIRELATKTVTLYPTRAEVVQDINDIRLKVGSVYSNCPIWHADCPHSLGQIRLSSMV